MKWFGQIDIYKHIFFLLLLTLNVPFQIGKTSVQHAFQFVYNFNSAVTFFILYNTLDVPLSANSVVTFLVNSRRWSFLRVVFSQTRNFTVIAFTGWIYCIENFFHLVLENRVCSEIFHCIEYIFYHSGFLSNLRLPWNTEFALKIFTVLNILYIQDFWATCPCREKQSVPWIHCIEYIFFIIQDYWATCACLENRFCPDMTVLNTYFLSFRTFEQLALALKNTSCPEMFLCIEILLSFRIFEQLALALKAGFALNSLYRIYIFYHSGFLSNLRLPWKQSLPWNFSRQGGRRPPRPPASYAYGCNILLRFIAAVKACAVACTVNAGFPSIVTQLRMRTKWEILQAWLSESIVTQPWVKPHAGAGCWRHKRRLKTSLRFVIAPFANLSDLDEILQLGVSDWYSTFHKS